MRSTAFFTGIALVIFVCRGIAPGQPAPTDQDLHSPAWWLQRAAAEANAATDPAARQDILDDIWTFSGSAGDAGHFAAAVDHFLKHLAGEKDADTRATSAVNYGRLVARLRTPEQARAVIAAGLDAAGKIDVHFRRDALLTEFAALQAEIGDAAGAIAGIGKLSDASARTAGYARLAAGFSKKGDNANYGRCIALAKQAIGQIKDPRAASGLWAALADAHVAAGDEAGARESLTHITDPWEAAGAHLRLAQLAGLSPEARAKDWSVAEDLAVTLPDARLADTMAAIADARSAAGDGQGAHRTLERGEKAVEALPRDVRRSYLALALTWSRLGDKAAAVRLLKRAGPAVPGPNDVDARQTDDLLAIAQAYRDLGDPDTAGRAAEAAHRAAAAEKTPGARVDAWAHVADADAHTGDVTRWRQDVAAGLAALAQLKPDDPAGPPPSPQAYREMLTTSAVANLATAGKIDEAKKLAGENATPEARDAILGAAAQTAARQGDFTAARGLSEGLPISDRSYTANVTAYAAARKGALAGAAAQLPRYVSPEERANVATAVVQALLELKWELPPVMEGP